MLGVTLRLRVTLRFGLGENPLGLPYDYDLVEIRWGYPTITIWRTDFYGLPYDYRATGHSTEHSAGPTVHTDPVTSTIAVTL